MLMFENDVRSTDPDASHHRKVRFRAGWSSAVTGHDYKAETLRSLTWDNMGWRLGKLFGETPDSQIDNLYDWCVEQQAAAVV